jgi:protein-tyrosine-phosphatase
MWRAVTGTRAVSAGTHPAAAVHPGAVAAARRAGIDLTTATPTSLADITRRPALTVTVCDRAHEELDPAPEWLHWSIPDPVPTGTRRAFDATVVELRRRIGELIGAP